MFGPRYLSRAPEAVYHFEMPTLHAKPRTLVALFATAALVAACAGSFVAPYKEPPCGYHGHSCGNGYCCDENYDCGGTGEFMGCPKNQCCANGGEAAGRGDAGAGSRDQRPESR